MTRAAARWGRVAGLLALVIALDQATKALVRARISPGDADGVFPGLQVVRIRNNGVAFGLFSGGGAIVLVLTGIALLALVVFFARHPFRRGLWVPTGLLLGGAAGNIVDRVRLGAVTDFLKVPLWPAFNVADVAITIGVLALLYVLEAPRRA